MTSFNPKRLKMSWDESCSTVTKEEERVFAFDSSDFNDVVKTKAFVDKTLLIKAILRGPSKIQINAPPRFGKSTNMGMLKKFLEIQVDECGAVINREESSNYEIFKGHNLLIYQDRDFFNEFFATYPVIYFDLKSITGNTLREMNDKFRFIVHETFKVHHYLLQSGKLDSREKEQFQMFCGEESYINLTANDISYGLIFLAKSLYKHFNNKEVFVLIDEFDAPVNNIMDISELREVDDKFECMLTGLTENEYVNRAFVTSVSCFFIGMFAPKDLKRYMFLDDHQFMKFYGLTEVEVNALLGKFNIDEETKAEVKSYYGGYCSVDSEKLFSICSVLRYLQNKELKSYWQQCDTVSKLKNALTFPDIRESIEELCLRNFLSIKLFRYKDFYHVARLRKICLGGSGLVDSANSDIFFLFLLEQGYLTLEKAIEHTFWHCYTVKIPNSEIFDELQEQLKEYYGPSVNSCLDACADIFKGISSCSEDGIFQDFISKFILLLKELHIKAIKNGKVTCRYLLYNILCKAKYSIGAELHVAEGNPYLIFYKDRLGIIIEVTYAQTADVALEDITEKYVKVFDEELCLKNVTEKIYMGLNVNENDTANMKLLVNCVDLTEAKTF